MWKHYFLFGLMTLVTACGKRDHERDPPAPVPVQTPAPTPTSTPVPQPTSNPIQVSDFVPLTSETKDLPDDYGFTATYSDVGGAFYKERAGDYVLKVRKDRVQLRSQGERDILDCHSIDDKNPTITYKLEGVIQDPLRYSPFLEHNCRFIRDLTRPVMNLEALCKTYKCTDEKVGDFESVRVGLYIPQWIDKATKLRVQKRLEGGQRILKMIPGAPTDADFANTDIP